MSKAYLQTPLDDESKSITTLNTFFGLYRYKYFPFGLSVSPGIFQGIMDNIFLGAKGVVVYQDDILVYGKTKKITIVILSTPLIALISLMLKLTKTSHNLE